VVVVVWGIGMILLVVVAVVVVVWGE